MARSDKRPDPTRITTDPAELEEQIRVRAYELYEARGREDGRDVDDWVQAEAEILATQRRAAAA